MFWTNDASYHIFIDNLHCVSTYFFFNSALMLNLANKLTCHLDSSYCGDTITINVRNYNDCGLESVDIKIPKTCERNNTNRGLIPVSPHELCWIMTWKLCWIMTIKHANCNMISNVEISLQETVSCSHLGINVEIVKWTDRDIKI